MKDIDSLLWKYLSAVVYRMECWVAHQKADATLKGKKGSSTPIFVRRAYDVWVKAIQKEKRIHAALLAEAMKLAKGNVK